MDQLRDLYFTSNLCRLEWKTHWKGRYKQFNPGEFHFRNMPLTTSNLEVWILIHFSHSSSGVWLPEEPSSGTESWHLPSLSLPTRSLPVCIWYKHTRKSLYFLPSQSKADRQAGRPPSQPWFIFIAAKFSNLSACAHWNGEKYLLQGQCFKRKLCVLCAQYYVCISKN